MYWLLFNAFMGVCIFVPLQIAKRKREPNEFVKSDLISATASIAIFYLASMMTGNFLVGWIASLAIMIPLSIKSSAPGELLISIFKKLLPKNLRSSTNSMIVILTAATAFIVISLTYHVTPPLWVFIEVCLAIAVSCFAFSKIENEPLKSFIKNSMPAKENRNAFAIAIGSAAIVFAILFSNISQNNQPASNGATQMIRGVPRWHDSLKQNVYDCPAGYGPKGGVTIGGSGTDPWCYKKN